jgi:outer membrane biosynthesis protein TonB
MTCDEARERLSALLDEALSPDERGALDAHLAVCVDCRRELGLLKNTVALLRKVDPARAPAGFVDRVRAAARPVPWWRRLVHAVFRPWPVRVSLGATAVVLVSMLVGVILRATAPELEQAVRVEPPSPAVVAEAPRPQEPPAKPSEPPRAASERREERAQNLADAPRRRDVAKAAPATTPAPAPAPPVERKAEPAARAGAAARETAQEAIGADTAASRLSSLRAPAADVAGRLAVKDRAAATRALADLVAKAGGTEVARNAGADVTVVELTLPRAAWPEFTGELAGLGTWTPEREPVELPAQIRVTLRITE